MELMQNSLGWLILVFSFAILVRFIWDTESAFARIYKLYDMFTGSVMQFKQSKACDEAEPHSPTANAELILHLLLRPDEAEAVGGDLQERYLRKVEWFGERRARLWLWSQVLRSIWPLLKRFVTAGGFLAAADFIRKLLS